MSQIPTIRQRGNSFAYTLDLGKRSDGTRNRITKGGFGSYQEAEEHAIKEVSKKLEGKLIGTSQELFDITISTWLEYKVTEVRHATSRNIRNVVTSHIQPFFTGKRTSDIDMQNIRDFYIHLDKKGLAASSIKNVRISLSECLEDAVNRGVIIRNPVKMTKAPSTRKKGKKKFDYWEKDEINDFLMYARSSEWYIGFLISLTTGCRQGELLALTWENVNFRNNTITFDQSFAKAEIGYEIANTKTISSERTIGMPKRVMDEIARYKDLPHSKSEKVFNRRHDYVVHTSNGTPVQPPNFYNEFISIVKASGVHRIRPHDMRHTHATMLLEAGKSVKEVSERLGHSSIVTTMEIYAHVTPRMGAELNQAVDNLVEYLSEPEVVYLG